MRAEILVCSKRIPVRATEAQDTERERLRPEQLGARRNLWAAASPRSRLRLVDQVKSRREDT